MAAIRRVPSASDTDYFPIQNVKMALKPIVNNDFSNI